MDDRTSATTTTKALLLVAGFLVLALPVRDAFGDHGVEAVLAMAMLAVGALAYRELTGRPLPWHRSPEPAEAGGAAGDLVEWRSERWVREAVERGLRAMDEWRLEQRDA